MPRFRTIGDVLDLAITREVEAQRLYANLAQLATRPEVRSLIRRLETDEVQHRVHLEAIKAGEVAFTRKEEVGSLHIEEALAEITPQPEMSYADLLIIGMKKEKTAFMLYTNLASIATSEALRDVLTKLAQEEAEHKLRLEIEYDWATF